MDPNVNPSFEFKNNVSPRYIAPLLIQLEYGRWYDTGELKSLLKTNGLDVEGGHIVQSNTSAWSLAGLGEVRAVPHPGRISSKLFRLTPLGKQIIDTYSTNHELFYDLVHLIFYSTWRRSKDVWRGRFWLYASVCDALWLEAPSEMDSFALTNRLQAESQKVFPDFAPAFPERSVRAVFPWLGALSPPFLSKCGTKSQLCSRRRSYCTPQLFHLATDLAYTVEGLKYGTSMALDERHIEAICRVCLLDVEHFWQMADQSRRLRTRLTGYDDRHEDLDGWRLVSDIAVDLNQKARNAEQVYHHADFLPEVDHLWAALRARFEAQPLDILGKHGDAAKQIEAHRKRVVTWLESRREDFDRQCQAYQQALADAGIEADLRVPFDQEHPTESYDVLTQSVGRAVSVHLGTLERGLGTLLQVARYGIQVQRLPLEDAESRIRFASQHVTEASGQITTEVVRDLRGFQAVVLARVVALDKEERELTGELQRAIQPRAPEDTEVRLMELISVNATDRQTDLRELIIRLLDQGEEKVNLNALMKDLQSLFQKNQIAIHISLLQGEHR